MKSNKLNRRGMSLMAVFIMFSIISFIGISILVIQQNMLSGTISSVDNTQAEYIAFTGIQRAFYRINTQASLVKNYCHYTEGAYVYFASPWDPATSTFRKEDVTGKYLSSVPGIFRFDAPADPQRIAVNLQTQAKIEYIGVKLNNEDGSPHRIGAYVEVFTEDDPSIPIDGVAVPPSPAKKWGRTDNPDSSVIFFNRPAGVNRTQYILFQFGGNGAEGTDIVEIYAYPEVNDYPQSFEFSPDKYKSENIKGVYTYDIRQNTILCTGRLLKPTDTSWETVGIHSILATVNKKEFIVILERYRDVWEHIPVTDAEITAAAPEKLLVVE